MKNATQIERKIHNIDATDKVLGKLAVQISLLLRGKNKRGFMPNVDAGDFVEIVNVSKMKFTGNKIDQKKYFRHSGYLGGTTEEPLKDLFKTNPAEVLRRAVFGMFPKNKLRSQQIKRLKFK